MTVSISSPLANGSPHTPVNATRIPATARTTSLASAAGLFFLAPLIAEFLLGNLPVNMLPALVLLAPLYGGGALVIRESVRRTGRGWPSILLLGLAYAIVEEAFATQSLFNPDYLGLKLHFLDAGHIPGSTSAPGGPC